ncbi:DNA polymerase V [Enterobacteriaceae bacterium H16N7]|nr:DNA polymerase V [Dryocola clanedunensis]
MAKETEIKVAFTRAIKQDPRRGQIVTAADFVRELAKVNHHWSLRQANEWIVLYQRSFRDYTDHEGENKVYFMMNMGGVR